MGAFFIESLFLQHVFCPTSFLAQKTLHKQCVENE